MDGLGKKLEILQNRPHVVENVNYTFSGCLLLKIYFRL